MGPLRKVASSMALGRAEVLPHVSRVSAPHLRALVVALAAGTACAGVCKGSLNISGAESHLFASGHGADVLGAKLSLRHNSGFSITTSCTDEWDPNGFKLFHLLGKTLSFTVDLSKVGCVCTLAFYLTPLPAREPVGSPAAGTCSYVSYYCDASAACGHRCPELDLMQANKYAFSSTTRKCTLPLSGGHYSSCDQPGCAQNTNVMGVMDYGPGSLYTIDTTRPFQVSTDFYSNGWLGGSLDFSGMVTRLQQGPSALVLDHSPCSSSLRGMSAVMAAGMSLRVAYWGTNTQSMAWDDQPPCSTSSVCAGSDAGEAVVSDIRLASLTNAERADARQALAARPLTWQAELWASIRSSQTVFAQRLHLMPKEQLIAVSLLASMLLVIPGFLALSSCSLRRWSPYPSHMQQRSLSIPMQTNEARTYPAHPRHPQVFTVRQEQGLFNSLFACCCKREIPYAPFGHQGVHCADIANWSMQPINPRHPGGRQVVHPSY